MFLRAAVSTILPVKDAIVLLEFRYQYFKENLVAEELNAFSNPERRPNYASNKNSNFFRPLFLHTFCIYFGHVPLMIFLEICSC